MPPAAPDVHVVLPNDIDDPATPSGGNLYDRRVCQGLSGLGWSVQEHAVPGSWPEPGDADRTGLARVLAGIPNAAAVLLDGLVAAAVPEVLRRHAARLRLIPLIHLPRHDEAEAAALATATAVITTSDWSRQLLLSAYGLPAGRVHAAPPGVDPAPVAPGSGLGTELLCVAAVVPRKGHDVLVEALAEVADLPWRCVCVGALTPDPGFVDRLREQIRGHRLTDRVRLAGPRTGAGLAAAYAAADLLVLPSRGEPYGMVVTEALARGIPVLASAVDGLPEAIGRDPAGGRPGRLVPPEAPAALAAALRDWLTGDGLRARLRRSAGERRRVLAGWERTSAVVARVLAGAR